MDVIETDRATTRDIGPGSRLQQARKDRRLSIEEAARKLNLSPRHIEALENDEYQKLPGPTYVRGYLRSYAAFLELSPEKIIDAYNRLPEAAPKRPPLAAPAPAPQLTSSHALVKLASVLIGGLVIGLATVWWLGQESPSTDVALPPSQNASGAEDASQARTGEGNSESGTSEGREENSVVAATPEPEPVARAPEPAQEPTTKPAPKAEAPATPALPADAPRVRLVLYAHQETWADVRDARQERLVYENVAAGRVVTLEGVAPLQVFLGNVAGVEVEFNGRAYDAMKHKRGQVARFTLGTP